ncbi:MAG: glycosyl transferase [Deltaproteobacteria bacterium]|nr:glycosyl transferase [Deltaproteobacteria bacterium]
MALDPAALLARHHDPTPHGRWLSNGRYALLLTGAGTGVSRRGAIQLTGFRGDRVEDAEGLFLWLRDAESGAWTRIASGGASAAPGRMVFTESWQGLATRVEACVAPDADLELRRIEVRNASERPRRIVLTAAAELVLAPPAVHAAHPALAKLFVETEAAGEGVLLARRRPRSAGEAPLWMGGALAGPGGFEAETDRARFLGRGRSWPGPRAVAAPDALAGSTGSVLDPVLAFRRSVRLAPGEAASWLLLLGSEDERAPLVAALARLAQAGAADAALLGAAARERALAARLGLDGAACAALHELAVAITYGHPGLRADPALRARVRGTREELLQRGHVPERLLVVELSGPDAKQAAPEWARAQTFWDAQGACFDLLVLADDPEALAPAFEAAGAPRVALQAKGALAVRERELLLAAARLATTGAPPATAALAGPVLAPRDGPRSERLVERPLAHRRLPPTDNGFGRFVADGREYAIELGPGPDGELARPPMPWCNVVANERVGFVASEGGAATTWAGNGRENRLTPWSNDPVADPPGEALWLRDEEAGVFWSPLPAPAASGAPFTVRHGLGYTVWSHETAGLAQEVTRFVPLEDPLAVCRVRIENRSGRPRRLALFALQRLVIGATPEDGGRTVVTDGEPAAGALVAENAIDPGFGAGVAFGTVLAPPGVAPGYTTDRAGFVGRAGTLAAPAAVTGGAPLDGALGADLDPCFAWRLALALAPGAAVECSFLLGQERDRAAVRALLARWRAPGAVERALGKVHAEWERLTGALRVRTPVAAFDQLAGGWLLHQALGCRQRGRSGFYQPGGAFGFRDQLQDAAALVWAAPEHTRSQLLLHAAHQFVEGDVLHGWHPPGSKGIRTRRSDDPAWLPYVTAVYVGATGDEAVLDEPVPFLRARELAPGEDEALLTPEAGPETAPLHEHCLRALERAATRGVHGLPLMGSGDGSDGMDRVGREGRGESVWLGFFLYHVLERFLPLAERRGEAPRAARLRAYQADLRQALDAEAWDGAWYKRAWYDDGTPLGTAGADECRVDALVQAWSVLSGAARPERAAAAIDAVERELVDGEAGLVRRLWPPFDRSPHAPGFLEDHPPGIRENGGQSTHAALWVVRALAELGRRDRAAGLLERITPQWHARSREAVATYQVEPYVVAADVYGVSPHRGRGGWTWSAGSAGGLYRVLVETVLGLRLEAGRRLRLRPRIPDAWPGFELLLRAPDGRTRYAIRADNPGGRAGCVVGAQVDGRTAAIEDGAALVPLASDGALHEVRVLLG